MTKPALFLKVVGWALGLAALAGCAGVGEHVLTPWRVDAGRGDKTWQAVFARPAELRVTAWVTGEVFTGPSILIDANNPRTPAADKKEQWVPSVAYLVEHPSQGRFLMDAGVAPAQTGPCAYGLRPFYWVPCRTAEGRDVVARLHGRGLSARGLRFLMLSHFHGDHIGGLQSLLRDGLETVLTTPEEWSAVTSWKSPLEGYLDAQVRGSYAVGALDRARAVEMPYVGQVWDLFADGSVWLIPVAGHSRGQLAALLNTSEGPLLFSFDASHLRSNLEHRVIPGATVDETQALAAIDRLRALISAYPALRVFYGHEPTQWAPGPEEVVLAQPASRGTRPETSEVLARGAAE